MNTNVDESFAINKYRDYSTFSFDVFDTLITRKVVEPKGIFNIIKNKIKKVDSLPDLLRNNFEFIRVGAEQNSRKNLQKNVQEVTIEEIYNNIKDNHNITDSQKDYLIKTEIETELNNILPLSKNIELLKQLIQNNKRVFLISDMYLSASVIKELLLKIDSVFEKITIYSSADIKKTKHTGDLFDYIKKELQLNCKEWVHFGDNDLSDGIIPAQKGITVCKIPKSNVLKHESYILERFNDYYSQLAFGTAHYLINKKTSPDYRFATSFAAPFLFNYVYYVINSLIKNNAKEAYFISRDGYILKEIADKIISVNNFNLTTKYIYGSRKSWRIPCESNYESFIKLNFREFKNKLSLSFLSERLRIPSLKLREYVSVNSDDIILDEKNIKNLQEALLTIDNLKSNILDSFKKQADLAIRYIESNISLDDDTVFFVDVHGSGNTINLLYDLVKNKHPKTTFFTYYYSNSGEFIQKENCTSHFFNMNYMPIGHWVELLCRADHGQTIGYEYYGEKIKPILAQFDLSNYSHWNYVDYLNGVTDFTETFATYLKSNSLNPTIKIQFSNLFFEALFLNEDKFLCNIYGNIPYNDSGLEEDLKPSCPPITLSCVKRFLQNQTIKLDTIFSLISIGRSNWIMKNIFYVLRYYNTFSELIYSKKINNNAMYLTFLGIKLKINPALLTYKSNLKRK